jgi:hypothetical protein
MSNSFETIVDSHSLKNNVTQLVDPATPKHDTGTMSERVLCSDPVASQKLLLSPPTDTVTPKQDTGSTTHRVLHSDPHASEKLFLSLSTKNPAITLTSKRCLSIERVQQSNKLASKQSGSRKRRIESGENEVVPKRRMHVWSLKSPS